MTPNLNQSTQVLGDSQFHIARCRSYSCTAWRKLLKMSKSWHWPFVNNFLWVTLNEFWIIWSILPWCALFPFKCLALGYILNYYIKVIKMWRKKINKGRGGEFSPSKLPWCPGPVVRPWCSARWLIHPTSHLCRSARPHSSADGLVVWNRSPTTSLI